VPLEKTIKYTLQNQKNYTKFSRCIK